MHAAALVQVVAALNHAMECAPWSAYSALFNQSGLSSRCLVTELEHRQLFRTEGRMQTLPWIFRQSVDAYIESFHRRASFAREHIDAKDASAFDQHLRELVTAHTQALVELPLIARIVWGKPLVP
jgi:hypothetical protein